ncbi:hypothetical protein SAMD00019534_046400, partial [Acytostelium subglobosum LB1]|uniref:hypothetical protein n=1 Tax=Acytostelium subglobosum LB1 TaxID=1410327 RepID=UPI0006450569
KWFDTLETYYTPTATRCYHNFNHIDELLSLFDTYRHRLTQPAVCQLAIWFHDVVYDPTKHDNEDLSAQLFKQFTKDSLVVAPDVQDQVIDYIDCTKNHTKHPAQGNDRDYFLDMDLSILGRPTEEYLIYSHNIRREYIHVPEDQYRTGRSTILKRFIDMGESIYKTPEFRAAYARQALTNLQNEVDRLADLAIPL